MVARGRGGIVLLSSMASLQGGALVAHYAATKAYLRVLAEGLWEELRPAGVDVVACCAGRVRTPTWKRSGPRAATLLAPPVMEAEPVVEATLAALGRQPVVIPGRLNRLAALATSRLLPRPTAVALVSAATRRMYRSGRAGWRRPARPAGRGRSGRSRRG
jgi:short-subunit dehydrogenase